MGPSPSSDIAANGHAKVEGDTTSLTKNQKKKRRKRKTGKETSEAKAETIPAPAAPSSSRAVSGVLLNPVAQVHAQVMAEGFTAKEVELAMEEMWDKGMNGYDEFEAVLAYLRSMNGSTQHKPEAEKAQDEPTSDMSSTKESTEPSMDGYAHEKETEAEKEEIEERTVPSHPMDIGAKLDLVSDNEVLVDAAFALSEWISKAAKLSDVEDFCAQRKSRALSTIIGRAIEEPCSSSFEKCLPAVLGLVDSIFCRAGMDAMSVEEMKGNLRLVLQQARTAYLKNTGQDEAFAERVTLVIVTRISGLFQDLMSRSDDDASKSVRHLEKEIDSLSCSLHSVAQGGIIELIQNRDMQKSATEKASRVVNITMSSAVSNGVNRHVTAKILAHASATKDEVLLSLVGPDGLEKMKQNKLAHDDVRQKLKSVEDRTSPEYQALNINLHTFQAERTAVQEKMEELKNALKRLEEEDTMINRKIIETQKEISSLDETCNGEVAMLKKELAQASKTAESDNSIRALANQLAVYESSVKNSVNVSSAVSTGNENIAEIIPNKIGLYLTRARNYFRSEADCVQFLRNRVRTLEKEIISLRNQLEEFTSLGLTTNARQVSHSISQKLENIEDDNHVIDTLCGEAVKMCDELADKLEKYVSIDKFDAHLSSIHMTVLRGIVSAISEIGLEGMGGLAQFVESGSNGHVALVPTKPVTVIGSNPTVVRSGQGAAVAPADLATKLTWAKPDGQVKKAEVKSLLNIQKEELSSKDS